MAKKQVIWSRSAKKDIYSFLESHFKKYGDKKLTSLFFSILERKISMLRKNKLLSLETSRKNIRAFKEDDCVILFEEQDKRILIHNVSEIVSVQENPL